METHNPLFAHPLAAGAALKRALAAGETRLGSFLKIPSPDMVGDPRRRRHALRRRGRRARADRTPRRARRWCAPPTPRGIPLLVRIGESGSLGHGQPVPGHRRRRRQAAPRLVGRDGADAARRRAATRRWAARGLAGRTVGDDTDAAGPLPAARRGVRGIVRDRDPDRGDRCDRAARCAARASSSPTCSSSARPIWPRRWGCAATRATRSVIDARGRDAPAHRRRRADGRASSRRPRTEVAEFLAAGCPLPRAERRVARRLGRTARTRGPRGWGGRVIRGGIIGAGGSTSPSSTRRVVRTGPVVGSMWGGGNRG